MAKLVVLCWSHVAETKKNEGISWYVELEQKSLLTSLSQKQNNKIQFSNFGILFQNGFLVRTFDGITRFRVVVALDGGVAVDGVVVVDGGVAVDGGVTFDGVVVVAIAVVAVDGGAAVVDVIPVGVDSVVVITAVDGGGVVVDVVVVAVGVVDGITRFRVEHDRTESKEKRFTQNKSLLQLLLSLLLLLLSCKILNRPMTGLQSGKRKTFCESCANLEKLT